MVDMWRRIDLVLTATVILAPVVILAVTGSVGWAAIVLGVEALLGVAGRTVARRLGLPAWTPEEAYITRLQRWRRTRVD
jgi:hypothetical protein